jgi:CP family cyanate transporter-like MFS transporter
VGPERRVHGVALLAALFLGAMALRPQLIGAAPLLPDIDDDLGISHAVAGLLGTIPVLCMGLFAFPASHLAVRFGTRGAIGACLAGIAAFGFLRALAPGAPLVLGLTFPIGVAMGVAGALMPVAVKERFAHRPVFASGVYITGMNLGAALASALAVPIAAAWGGWRVSFAVFSGATLLCVAAWLLLTPSRPRGALRAAAAPPPRVPWRRGLVWGLVGIFGLQALIYYGLNAWLPDAFQEQGWSDGAAGALVALMAVCALPAGLVVPFMADRFGSRRQWLSMSATALIVATAGIAAVPDLGWLWVVLAGLGLGSVFPLVMTLPLDVAHEPGDVGAVVALVLGGGYSIGALAPFVLGAVRDATGSFATSLWVLVAVAVALLASVVALSPGRLLPPERSR